MKHFTEPNVYNNFDNDILKRFGVQVVSSFVFEKFYLPSSDFFATQKMSNKCDSRHLLITLERRTSFTALDRHCRIWDDNFTN